MKCPSFCFATGLVWTEITSVKTSPNTEVGVVHVFAPAQYFGEIERLVTAQFGTMKAFNYKSDKNKPFLQIRTGKANNSVSNQIYNWINTQRSQVYYENPNLSPDYSASQQGYTDTGNDTGGDNKALSNTPQGNNNLYLILGAIAVAATLFIIFKKKK